MGDDTIYWNRTFNVEFLDDYLCIKDNTNTLQQNLFTILSSIEMIATSCLFAIIHVTICMQFRWLTGNTHKIDYQNWSARSILRAIDILHTAWNNLIYDPRLTHDKSFMMRIYDPIMNELPDFKDYMEYWCKYQTYHYAASSKTREVPPNKLIKELFTPTDRYNQDITNVLEKITVIGIQAFLDELIGQ